MSSIEFSLKDDDIKRINDSIMSYGTDAESIINSYLREVASHLAVDSIKIRIPASNKSWKGKGKSARSGNPFVTDFVNLGFKIRSKTAYNYLYFPDQGEGTSKNKNPLEFMDKGLDSVYDTIVDGIIKKLVREE